MSDDAYDMVARGKLKLKSDSSKISKKKKKDKKNREKMERQLSQEYNFEEEKPANGTSAQQKMTKAEQSFKKMQEKMQEKRIMEKATLTHKQRVEKFNEKLDNLTEHFDIPKVSWTK